jgi:hypothetical protein
MKPFKSGFKYLPKFNLSEIAKKRKVIIRNFKRFPLNGNPIKLY